jgi:hypothetical protein
MLMAEFIEIKMFGLNWVTVFAFACIAMTLSEIWALVEQNRKIKKHKSGLALVNAWFIYFPFMFLACAIYGLERKSLALVASSIAAFFYIPIIFNLLRYNKRQKKDIAVFCSSASALVAMGVYNVKGLVFAGFQLIAVFILALEPIEILRARSTGVLDIRLIIVYCINTSIWLGYGLAAGDKLLALVTSLTLIVLSSIIIIWFWLRKGGGAMRRKTI